MVAINVVIGPALLLTILNIPRSSGFSTLNLSHSPTFTRRVSENDNTALAIATTLTDLGVPHEGSPDLSDKTAPQKRTNEMSGLFQRSAHQSVNSVLKTPFATATTQFPANKELGAALERLVKKFQGLVHEFTSTEQKNRAVLGNELKSMLTSLQHVVNALLESASTLDTKLQAQLAAQVTALLRPLCLQGDLIKRVVTKPRGYAGDFLTIEMIYNYEPPESLSPFGQAVDRAFLSLPAAKAVVNRRKILTNEFVKAVRNKADLQITVLASGPGREVNDFFVEHAATHNTSIVNFHLVDLDEEALEFVDNWRSDLHPSRASRIKLYQKNLLFLCSGRETLSIPPQDLVYSMGLIDYFSDKVVVRLLNYIHDKLRPGGKVILGNFHPCNPTRGLMDTVLDWKLNHRNEDDMNQLFASSKFGRDCTLFVYDDQGVQLLACCEK